MAFLGIPTSKQDLSNSVLNPLAGGAAQVFGTVTGNQHAVDVGKNITNPAVNIQGAANPVYSTDLPGGPGASGYGQPKTDTTNTPSGAYSGSGGASGYDPGDLAYLDSTADQLRRMLGSAQTSLGQGLANLGDSFNRETGTANQARSRALENFAIQREDTTRDKQTAIGKVDTNARTLNDSLRRILGMAAGSGSSAYQFAAPNAVARQASQQRSSVLGDFAENDRNLTLSENRAKTDFESLLEDLERQRRERESELRGGILEREQDINTNLGNVAAERAKLLGGGYSQVRLAQQPFQDAINDRQSQLDSLFERFRSPTLTPKAVNVQKPELRDYLVDRAAINANTQQGESQYSPYSQFLRKQDEEERLA